MILSFIIFLSIISGLFFVCIHYKNKSEKDLFTGCYNKDWFMSCKNNKLVRIMRDTHKNKRKSFGILLLDMDKFKQYNDTKGHIEGDKLILDTVSAIRYTLRKGDIIARIGGDEFLIAVKNIKTYGFLEDLAYRMGRNVNLKTDRTVSIGTALYTDEMAINVNDLIKIADENMYEKKGK